MMVEERGKNGFPWHLLWLLIALGLDLFAPVSSLPCMAVGIAGETLVFCLPEKEDFLYWIKCGFLVTNLIIGGWWSITAVFLILFDRIVNGAAG